MSFKRSNRGVISGDSFNLLLIKSRGVGKNEGICSFYAYKYFVFSFRSCMIRLLTMLTNRVLEQSSEMS